MSTTPKQVSTRDLQARKRNGPKITMLTAYDATMASLLDAAGVDALLVGDSLGMVVQGHSNTLGVTLDHMVYHTAAVARGAKRAHVVADLPFMSYQLSPEQALASAGRLLQEGGAHSVKLEGGTQQADAVDRLVQAGIPVMGHIGLTPQSVHQQGGFRVQGRTAAAARTLLTDARTLEAAGCYALVLEGIPAALAAEITAVLRIPTIGIGAGPDCDGQVLVSYDMWGMNPDFKPKFLKRFASGHSVLTEATQQYIREVQEGTFPAPEHCFKGSGLRPPRAATSDASAQMQDRPFGSAIALPSHSTTTDNDMDSADAVYGAPV